MYGASSHSYNADTIIHVKAGRIMAILNYRRPTTLLTMTFPSKLLLALALLVAPAYAGKFKVPFLTKKTYTPLVFFKLPRGASPHCE